VQMTITVEFPSRTKKCYGGSTRELNGSSYFLLVDSTSRLVCIFSYLASCMCRNGILQRHGKRFEPIPDREDITHTSRQGPHRCHK
jgi:hypothetical protein